MNPDYILVSVYDKKASNYSPVVAYPSRAAAVRSFVALLSSADSVPAQWPDDFDLYQMGAYHTTSGTLVPLPHPEHLISGQSAIALLMQSRAAMSQARGAAVGGVASPTPPEDSEASAERNGSVTSESPVPLSSVQSYKDTPSLFNNNNETPVEGVTAPAGCKEV